MSVNVQRLCSGAATGYLVALRELESGVVYPCERIGTRIVRVCAIMDTVRLRKGDRQLAFDLEDLQAS